MTVNPGGPPAPVVPDVGPHHDRWWAVVPGFMAVWGWVGVAGLVGGAIDLGATLTARLPFASPGLAATGLALAVAVPMSCATVAVAVSHRWAAAVTVFAGVALVGWIALEIAVIRTFSPMQPACVGWALLTIASGTALTRRRDAPVDAGSSAAPPPVGRGRATAPGADGLAAADRSRR